MGDKELADALLKKDKANLVEKVKRGQPLLKHERQLIRSWKNGDSEADVLTASTVVELANALSVTRQTLTRWRRLKGAPKPAPNGTHDVSLWREFIAKKKLNPNGANSAASEDSLKTRKLAVEVEEKEFRLALRKGTVISREIVREAWLEKVGRAVSILRGKFEKELPPMLVGMEAPQIAEELGKVIDQVMQELHDGKSESLTP